MDCAEWSMFWDQLRNIVPGSVVRVPAGWSIEIVGYSGEWFSDGGGI